MDADGSNLQQSTQQIGTAGPNQAPLGHLEWLEALHPEDSKSTMRTMEEALQTGSPFDIEYQVRDIDAEVEMRAISSVAALCSVGGDYSLGTGGWGTSVSVKRPRRCCKKESRVGPTHYPQGLCTLTGRN
jgi:hypothetical protein